MKLKIMKTDFYISQDQTEHTLDLNESQHCKITEIQKSFSSLRLVVRSTRDNTTAICNVEGFW